MSRIFNTAVIIVFIILVGIVVLHTPEESESPQNTTTEAKEMEFNNLNLNTDTSKTLIDLDQVLGGGPGKDGIPAINEPKFVTIQQSEERDDTRGILVDIDGEQRYYPYTILVWHEIVNDNINDNHFSVTFCPLCASGIVFNREVDNKILQFGVSGLLFESNLLMYDTETESLWSQARGEAVIGTYIETKLEVLPLQLITFGELKGKYPNAKVLSRDTSYNRNYGVYPYGDYESTEGLIFPVSVSDNRFFSKELMYIVPVGDKYVAIQHSEIQEGESRYTAGDIELAVSRNEGEIFVRLNNTIKAGYYELWFSFATHHQENGLVAEKI